MFKAVGMGLGLGLELGVVGIVMRWRRPLRWGISKGYACNYGHGHTHGHAYEYRLRAGGKGSRYEARFCVYV